MARSEQSTRSLMQVVPFSRKPGSRLPSELQRQRTALASAEDQDAGITGMTRSLDRRLLALNLQPMAAVGNFSLMKVA